MVFGKEELSYDKYLQSEIMMHCLKRCISSSHLSPAVKVKVLSLKYDSSESFDESSIRSESVCSKITLKSESSTIKDCAKDINFLGIDEDILSESPEHLTLEERQQLEECISEQISLFHKFCTNLDTNVKFPLVEVDISELLQQLDEQILEQKLQIEKLIQLQVEACDVKLESYNVFKEIIERTVGELQSSKLKGRKLLEEIDKEMMVGDRARYLEKAEEILEKKIAKDKEEIEKLKLELLGLKI
ncbi:synaptonemal complex protein 1 [Halyomorpha halys]|uniref:synaptonemal complex protein 1 n=1 Tax=Halyomorpha halys TaxID=286706 RepID=UPI0006D4D1F8|nr:uncharacterized protein LOC106682629 [Halyomorpha halys]